MKTMKINYIVLHLFIISSIIIWICIIYYDFSANLKQRSITQYYCLLHKNTCICTEQNYLMVKKKSELRFTTSSQCLFRNWITSKTLRQTELRLPLLYLNYSLLMNNDRKKSSFFEIFSNVVALKRHRRGVGKRNSDFFTIK